MKSQWILYVLMGFMFSSCYKDEDIDGKIPEPKYKVEDSDDPVDHYIYEFNQQYGNYILYEYQEVDYRWNMNTLLDVTLVKQKEQPILNEGIQYMKQVLFDDYSDEFKKKYFPFKILIADSVQVAKSGSVSKDESAEGGLSFLAVGKIRSGISTIASDSLLKLKGEVQATLWARFLYNNEMLQLPEAFWSISDEYYGVNLKTIDGNSSLKPDEINAKKYGFWDRNRAADSGVSYCMAPDKTLDIYQFIQMIVTHTADEMKELMEGHDKLKDKYYLLINQVRDVYGVDIQAIGNSKSH